MVFGGSRLPDRKRQKRWRLPKRLTQGLGWTESLTTDLGMIFAHQTLSSLVLREGVLHQTKQINSRGTKG